MRRHSLSALAAAGLLAGGLTASASAADLGGNCCADLEERIAELEATTVRKGNRKVSLTVSGWVAEQVMWWDDGEESNIYVGGVGTTLSSHFKLTGQATIAPGYQAGYVIQVETNSNEPLGWNQSKDDGSGPKVDLLQSYWFINSDRLGKLSMGQLSHASDNVAILVDGSGSLVPANWVDFDKTAFTTRSNGSYNNNLAWADFQFCQHISAGIGGDCNGVPQNAIRYDTPTFAGFSASASWGEDDFWDVAARYAGEFNGVKLAVAAAWSHYADERGPGGGAATVLHRDSDYFQIGAYIQHVPTGLFLYGAYGHEDNNNINFSGIASQNDDHWYLKAGLRRKWNTLGHTVMFGEYGERNDMYSPFAADSYNVVGSKVQNWGLGLVQEIDAAAMSMWLVYRHSSGDYDSYDGEFRDNTNLENFDLIKFGALINF